MPIYEYVCTHCKEEQEIFHLMSEDLATTPCPLCKKGTLERMISKLTKVKSSCHSRPEDRIKDFISNSSSDLKRAKEDLLGRDRK